MAEDQRKALAAFDVDARKVGTDVHRAIFSLPNCTTVFQKDIPDSGVIVKMGPVLDGISEHMANYADDRTFIRADAKEMTEYEIVAELKRSGTEVLLCYMPVGSEEAARFYAVSQPTPLLLALFERIRGDQLQRRFLGPRLLESLYVLRDPLSLPLFQELLVAGHTDPDFDHCEVTRALVAVRRLTGRLAPSIKFPDVALREVSQVLDDAERRFDAARDRLDPVTVL